MTEKPKVFCSKLFGHNSELKLPFFLTSKTQPKFLISLLFKSISITEIFFINSLVTCHVSKEKEKNFGTLSARSSNNFVEYHQHSKSKFSSQPLLLFSQFCIRAILCWTKLREKHFIDLLPAN